MSKVKKSECQGKVNLRFKKRCDRAEKTHPPHVIEKDKNVYCSAFLLFFGFYPAFFDRRVYDFWLKLAGNLLIMGKFHEI